MVDFYYSKMNNNFPMNTNETCLINYLSFGKYEQKEVTNSLINFLLKRGMKFKFNDLNPVLNIINEMEFFEYIQYN